ncbi:hypothetical protein KBY58_07425 [Cyanobium sp. HWJ4-Hawea]|uniref:hypothetical protein n=1 Tax=Cyanobium sp. HWJ4-Hawea TaxID=2823713 RepID=UPI0020CCEC59|nr:hypothetical protein [Cyanobium sp. HWJ4-Hawea]MCP9809262.1 hypothetical protein [Cyanobium sp. HWJ4-Hawea]
MAPLPEVIECCRGWINGQELWLAKAIKKQQSLDKRYVLLGSLCFLLALAASIAYWLAGAKIIDSLWAETLIGCSVAFFGYRELIGYGDTNARYGRSRAQFARAREALSLARPDPHSPGMLKMRQQLGG